MKEIQYFLNKENKSCSPQIPSRYTNYLDKNNFLSEFQSEESKENVRDNLGITQEINILKQLLDTKVIESDGIAWDLTPTEGNTEQVLSSDALYKEFSKYVTKQEFDLILQEISENFNKKVESAEELKESIYDQLYSSISSPLNKRMRNIELQMETFLKSHSTGDAFASQFGTNDYIGVNQHTLTSALKNIWDKLEEISGESFQGVDMTVSPEYFITEDKTNIHITVVPVRRNEPIEHIAIYANGILLTEANDVTSLEYDVELEETTLIKCVATVLGVDYTRQKVVTHYNSLWLGAGNSYEDVMTINHIIPITEGLKGAYNVTVNSGEKIFIILGSKLPGFVRADMNGIEIPLEEQQITVEGNTYQVYSSVNTYSAGSYVININS